MQALVFRKIVLNKQSLKSKIVTESRVPQRTFFGHTRHLGKDLKSVA